MIAEDGTDEVPEVLLWPCTSKGLNKIKFVKRLVRRSKIKGEERARYYGYKTKKVYLSKEENAKNVETSLT